MKSKSITIILSVFIVLIIPFSLFAAGKIMGVITDAETGTPLPGANVFLSGTSLGAASDLEGKYVIPQVPPGKYVLRIAIWLDFPRRVRISC